MMSFWNSADWKPDGWDHRDPLLRGVVDVVAGQRQTGDDRDGTFVFGLPGAVERGVGVELVVAGEDLDTG